MKTAVNTNINVRVQNHSGSNIVTFRIGWCLDNGINNISSTIPLGSGGLQPGAYFVDIVHFTPMNVPNIGPHSIKIWIEADGETNTSNDTVFVNFIALSNYADKIVLFEEYTSISNPNCQYANTAAASIITLPGTAVAAFHTNDILSTTEGDSYFNNYFSSTAFTPAGVINMGEMGNYTANNTTTSWEEEVLSRTGQICPLKLTINPSLNTSSRLLSVDLTAHFKYSEYGNYYMNVYLLENGISGTQAGVSGTYIHNRVVRTLLGGASATSNIIPSNPIINTDYTKTYSYTIPTDWNLNKLSLIGIVFKKIGSLTEVVNAVTYNYDHSNIESKEKFNTPLFNIYPNPAKNEFNISLNENFGESELSILSIEGKLIYSDVFLTNKNEVIKVNIEDLSPGLYFVNLKNNKHSSVRKIIKQ